MQFVSVSYFLIHVKIINFMIYYIFQQTLYPVHCKHNLVHTTFTQCIVFSTLYTEHCTQYIVHSKCYLTKFLETEKYAHVTFFFNGGIEKQWETERRVMVPSPKVATYDLQPTMNAAGVAEEVRNQT